MLRRCQLCATAVGGFASAAGHPPPVSQCRYVHRDGAEAPRGLGLPDGHGRGLYLLSSAGCCMLGVLTLGQALQLLKRTHQARVAY